MLAIQVILLDNTVLLCKETEQKHTHIKYIREQVNQRCTEISFQCWYKQWPDYIAPMN